MGTTVGQDSSVFKDSRCSIHRSRRNLFHKRIQKSKRDPVVVYSISPDSIFISISHGPVCKLSLLC